MISRFKSWFCSVWGFLSKNLWQKQTKLNVLLFDILVTKTIHCYHHYYRLKFIRVIEIMFANGFLLLSCTAMHVFLWIMVIHDFTDQLDVSEEARRQIKAFLWYNVVLFFGCYVKLVQKYLAEVGCLYISIWNFVSN